MDLSRPDMSGSRPDRPAGTAQPTQSFQLRIDFTGNLPDSPVEIACELSGLRVWVTDVKDASVDVAALLTSRGVTTTIEQGLPVFPAAALPQVATIGELDVVPVGLLRPIWQILTSSPPTDIPLMVEAVERGVVVSWFSEDSRSEFVPFEAVPALLTLGLPFIAAPATWDLLFERSPVPVRVGTVASNPDGFYEISASAPQLVESAPIRGLFRIAESKYGVPISYVADLKKLRGFAWKTPPPPPPTRPQIPVIPIDLRPHILEAVPELLARSQWGGQVLAWDGGLGRRLAVLAALEAADAFPAVVVCPPWAVWLWQRNLDLFGRSYSLTSADADVLISTYHDLSLRRDVISPVAIVFDHPHDAPVAELSAAQHLAEVYPEALKFSLVSSADADLSELWPALALCRPAEFGLSSDLSTQLWRYSGDREAAARVHAEAYVHFRSHDSIRLGGASTYHQSLTRVVSLPGDLADELRRLATSDPDPSRALSAVLEATSAGTGAHLSPKLAAAMALARDELAEGRRVAVVSAHRSTLTMLRSAFTPTPALLAVYPNSDAVVAEAAAHHGPVVLLVLSSVCMPDLSRLDAVIFCDYPWNTDDIDRICGPADQMGPRTVAVVHAAGSVDDRLAVFAALRRETTLSFPAASAPPTESEARHLLAALDVENRLPGL